MTSKDRDQRGPFDVLPPKSNPKPRCAQAEAALCIRESADAYLVLARVDLRENRAETAAWNISRAEQLEPGNAAVPELKRAVRAKLAEKVP